MLTAFQKHLTQAFPHLKAKRLLIAISGGLDSVVLTHLLHQLGYEMALAHCNFNLRGAESDGDEQFVKHLAHSLNIPLHIQSFETTDHATQQGISIQMAARDLRYAYFDQLCEIKKYDQVLTAHHLDDQIETFLINLNRGAGLNGLQGIPQENGRVLRPLLPFSRDQISAFARENSCSWREDSSNSSNKYQRNVLRNKVLPLLHEALPDLKSHFASSLEYLKGAQDIVEDSAARFRESVITTTESGMKISIEKLQNWSNPKAYLYELLKEYGFKQIDEVMDLLRAQTGKHISSGSHILLKNRAYLELEKQTSYAPVLILIDNFPSKMEFYNSVLNLETLEVSKPLELVKANKSKNIAYLDAQKVPFPLTLRSWKQGDRIQPLGMKGTKLVSDVLTDSKVSFTAKEKIVVLTLDEEILWIVGIRSSNLYKVTSSTKTLIKLTYNTL